MSNQKEPVKVEKFLETRMDYNASEERSRNILGSRLASARKANGLYLRDVSRMVDVFGISITVNALSRMELGATVPNAYQLMALCFVYGITDITEFCEAYRPELNEEGLKKLREYRADLIATGKYDPAPRKAYAPIVYIDMPTAYMGVSAGTGVYLDGSDFEMKSYPENTVPDDADFALHVSGISMEPVYNDGQTVWVKRCEQLRRGDVGIFVCNGEGFIKVYEEQEPEEALLAEFADTDGHVHPQPVLISYNQAYPPRVIRPDMDFRIIGKVLQQQM